MHIIHNIPRTPYGFPDGSPEHLSLPEEKVLEDRVRQTEYLLAEQEEAHVCCCHKRLDLRV